MQTDKACSIKGIIRQLALHDAMREGLLTGSFFDTKVYAYSRRATSDRIIEPRCIFANSVLLKTTSEFFVTLLSEQFSEAQPRTDLACEGYTSIDEYDYGDDSDLEDVELEDESGDTPLVKNCADSILHDDVSQCRGSVLGSDAPGILAPAPDSVGVRDTTIRAIFLRNVASNTIQAFVFYLLTGIVDFAPLRSQSITVARSATRTPQHQAPSCSPKSMYRLAHLYGIKELQALAIQDIASKISHENIVPELFSSLTARYPEIQQTEVNFLIDKGFTAGVFAAMPTWISKVASGSLGRLSGDVLALLLQRLATKPVPRLKTPFCDECAESCPHRPSKKARNASSR